MSIAPTLARKAERCLNSNPARVDTEAIKARSEATILEAGGIVYPELPALSPRRELRSQEAIEGRMLALYAMQFARFIVSGPILAWLEKYDLMIHVSPEERRILSQEMLDAQDEHVLGWANEMLITTLWMLGIVAELPFTERFYDSIPEGLPNVAEDESPAPLRARLRLRPAEEIFEQLDLYYRLGRWTRAEMQAFRYVEAVNFDAVMERLRVLDWAFSIQDWDEVDVRNRG